MAVWFHCNKCFSRISSAGGVKYTLTSCGHIFCDKCATAGNEKSCYMCRSENTTIVLSSSLNPEVQFFFTDGLESLQKITKVIEFQKNHAQKLFEHLDHQNKVLEHKNKELQDKYEHSKGYIKKLMKQMETLQRDHARLRNLLKASVASPGTGNAFRGTPGSIGSLTGTPSTLTSTPGNPNRSIIRGQTGWSQNGVNNNMLPRGSATMQQPNPVFRQPSIYNDSSSLASVSTSSIGGSRTSMSRGTGVPNRLSYSSQSPSTFNFSGLNFRGSGRPHQPAGMK